MVDAILMINSLSLQADTHTITLQLHMLWPKDSLQPSKASHVLSACMEATVSLNKSLTPFPINTRHCIAPLPTTSANRIRKKRNCRRRDDFIAFSMAHSLRICYALVLPYWEMWGEKSPCSLPGRTEVAAVCAPMDVCTAFPKPMLYVAHKTKKVFTPQAVQLSDAQLQKNSFFKKRKAAFSVTFPNSGEFKISQNV